jgi:hypothetical protein
MQHQQKGNTMTKHLQGRLGRYDQQWRAVIASGQGRAATVGDHVTLHKRNGDLKKVTLTKLVGKMERPDGSRLSFYEFSNGWTDVVDVDVDDNVEVPSTRCKHGTNIGPWDGPDILCHDCENWDGDMTAKEASIYSRERI